ncbi:MAG: PrsW family glutamic-type intramembrane protease [Haloarculaceae archaeon]
MSSDDRDPVQAAYEGEADLYDVATWDDRNGLDALAVRVHAALRAAKSWALILLAAALFVAELVFVGLLVLDTPLIGLLSVLSVIPALLLAAYLWYGDPTRREPLDTMAVTFLLSVLFASFAAVVNSSLLPAFELLPAVGLPLFFFLVVGPIEETVKWLAIRVHAYRSDSFRTVVDGVVYGAIAGLGFATIENVFYIVDAFLMTAQAGGPEIQRTVQTATARAFVGPGHVIYSAFAGYYLGLARYNPGQRGPIVVKGLLVAVAIHALYNTLVSTFQFPGLSFVLFVVVYDGVWLAILFRKVARYRRYYQRAQAGLPADGAGPE